MSNMYKNEYLVTVSNFLECVSRNVLLDFTIQSITGFFFTGFRELDLKQPTQEQTNSDILKL